MDSQKVRLGSSRVAGTGVFAVEEIAPGEVIATFDGAFYDQDCPDWDSDLTHHAIQCAPTRFRDSNGIARFVNHSCEPNCGIHGLFDIVAMKPIRSGEEITWDYEMTEDSNWWRMECRCGAPCCRKTIGAYRNMPAAVRAKYKGFLSDWLVAAEPARHDNWNLLNTAQSLPIGYHLHAFETDAFKTDFRQGCVEFAHWFKSGRLFYAAIGEPAAPKLPIIRAVVSSFVADAASCARFVRGEIAEHELEPWNGVLHSDPVIYFSTIICPERRWLAPLYQSLLSDLRRFKQGQDLSFHLGLTIASSEDGARHLENNGFVPLQGPRYVGRYPFLVINAASARSEFWTALLDPPRKVCHGLSSAPLIASAAHSGGGRAVYASSLRPTPSKRA
jgi:hypothetical protein